MELYKICWNLLVKRTNKKALLLVSIQEIDLTFLTRINCTSQRFVLCCSSLITFAFCRIIVSCLLFCLSETSNLNRVNKTNKISLK